MRPTTLLLLACSLLLAACADPAAPPVLPVLPVPPVEPPEFAQPPDAGAAVARDVPSNVGLRSHYLGGGYDRYADAPAVNPCLQATTRRVPSADPVFRRFARPFSAAELATLTGGPLGSRVVLENASLATFLPDATDPASIHLIYGAEWRVGSDEVDPSASSLRSGDPRLDPASPAWGFYCGDRFVGSVDLGARLLVHLRLTFGSAAARAAFERQAGPAPAAWALGPAVAAMPPALAAQVRAGRELQLQGGDVFKVGQVAGLAGNDRLIGCMMGSVAACGAVASAAAAAAGDDDPLGLAAGAAATPGAMAYRLAAWPTVGGPDLSRLPQAPLAEARAALDAALRELHAIRERLTTLQSFGLETLELVGLGAVADRNLLALRLALQACFDGSGPEDAAGTDRCLQAARPETLIQFGYDPALRLSALPAP